MKLIDLSQPVFDRCPAWPGDPPARVRRLARHANQGWQTEWMSLSAHTGSHIDAPRHLLPRGAAVDRLPLDSFVGKAVIADLRDSCPDQPLLSGRIRLALLGQELKDRIVLLATGWGEKRARSRTWLHRPPFLGPEAARWLVKRKVRGVGIDHHSIGGVCEPFNRRTHKVLLQAGVWILEDLRFPPEVFKLPRPVQIWALPVNLRNMSAAFCRPVVVVK